MAVAVVFPGQGSQRTGMARDVHDRDDAARAAFDEASTALGLDVAALCFDTPAAGDDGPRIDLTEYAQPAILTAEIAMLRSLEARGFAPGPLGGHSLGEYTALVAAGVMPLADAVALVRERGRLMQEAVPVGEGGMTAILGKGLDVDAIAGAASAAGVDLANHNCGDQVVLSGRVVDLEGACEAVRRLPGHERVRALPLRVSAPFHSRRMKPVAAALRPLLEDRAGGWRAEAATRVASNADGGFHGGGLEDLIDALCRQAASPVRWVDNMRALTAAAASIVEVGPSAPLSAFFKKEGAAIVAVTDLASAERYIAEAEAESEAETRT